MAAIGLGVAGLGAGASALSANSASKRAAATSQANTDANVALARDIYGQNRDTLNPFVQRGNMAGNQMNALLGLGGSQMQGGPAFVGALPGVQPNALSQFQPTMSAQDRAGLGDSPGFTYQPTGGFGSGVAANAMNAVGMQPQGGIMPTVTTGAPQAQQTPQQAAEAGFDIFRNSTNYQNRLNSAMDAVSSMYSGIGGLQSGAAIRG
jgi:hypothetical protein